MPHKNVWQERSKEFSELLGPSVQYKQQLSIEGSYLLARLRLPDSLIIHRINFFERRNETIDDRLIKKIVSLTWLSLHYFAILNLLTLNFINNPEVALSLLLNDASWSVRLLEKRVSWTGRLILVHISRFYIWSERRFRSFRVSLSVQTLMQIFLLRLSNLMNIFSTAKFILD